MTEGEMEEEEERRREEERGGEEEYQSSGTLYPNLAPSHLRYSRWFDSLDQKSLLSGWNSHGRKLAASSLSFPLRPFSPSVLISYR